MRTEHTARLDLVPLTLAEAIAICENDRDGRGWAADYPTEGDVVVASIIREAGAAYDTSGPLGVWQLRLRENDEAIGGIGFLSSPEIDGAAEVGYGLAESVRGLGLATEALDAIVTVAEAAEVSVVVAMTAVANVPSQRVLERCGFTRGAEVLELPEDGPSYRWEKRLAT